MTKDLKPEDFHPVEDWQYDVACGYTRQGYESWLNGQIEADEDDPARIEHVI